MTDFIWEDSGSEVLFFHVCTDGTGNGIVHFDENDYRQAIIISALTALSCKVRIVCFVHMSTHSHFLVSCSSKEDARRFGIEYKTRYSRYVYLEHGERTVYRKVDSSPVPVTDLFHLRNCVSYILLNPVQAGMVRCAEQYRWSSFEAYFNNAVQDGRPVSSLKVVERRSILKTRQNVSQCNILVDADGSVVLKSFVDHALVEQLFKTKADFYKSLALTDSVSEEDKYVSHHLSYSDTEIIAILVTRSLRMFGKDNLHLLTKSEKYKLIVDVHKRFALKTNRVSRILRIDSQEADKVLGR